MSISLKTFYVLVTFVSVFAGGIAAVFWIGSQDQHLMLQGFPIRSILKRSRAVTTTFLPFWIIFWILLQDNIKLKPLEVKRFFDLLIATSILFCSALIGSIFFLI